MRILPYRDGSGNLIGFQIGGLVSRIPILISYKTTKELIEVLEKALKEPTKSYFTKDEYL